MCVCVWLWWWWVRFSPRFSLNSAVAVERDLLILGRIYKLCVASVAMLVLNSQNSFIIVVNLVCARGGQCGGHRQCPLDVRVSEGECVLRSHMYTLPTDRSLIARVIK